MLPRDALLGLHPELAEVLRADDDYFLDEDGLRYFLAGEAVFGSDGKYAPAASYPLAEAVRLTAAFCRPQWAQQQAADQAARRAAERRRQQEEVAAHAAAYREQQEAKREAQRAADDPARRLAEMERRLAALEGKTL
jgi:hypothetical protein